jgi:hypothetical protein
MTTRIFFISIVLFTLLGAFKPTEVNWQPIDVKVMANELKELQASYSKLTNYSVNIKYLTFDTKSNADVHDKSNGYMIKSGIYSKSRLLGIYSVQNEKLRVTIDSAKKTVQVSNAFKFEDPGFSIKDYTKILGICKAVKKATSKNVVAYRFETKNKEGLIAQELYIENGITKEVNVYYANEHFYRENNNMKKEVVYPRLQVLFSDYNPKIQVSPTDFSLDKIILMLKDKKIKLTPNYNGYKLIDGRIKK